MSEIETSPKCVEDFSSEASTTSWRGNTAPQSNASGQVSQEKFHHHGLYTQQPVQASRPSYGPHDSRIGTLPLLSDPVLVPTSVIHPGQFAVPYHLGVPSDQPVYHGAPLHYAITARPACVSPQEVSWQGYTTFLYASPYASVLSYHNPIPYFQDVSGSLPQPVSRLAPTPRGAPDSSLDHHLQNTGNFGAYTNAPALPQTPNPDYLQAQNASLYRWRSAPTRASTPAARQLAAHTEHPEPQSYSLSPQSHEITSAPSIFGTFAFQTGITWEAYKCQQCNKVLQDERGLKRHELTHNKNFALGHICEECDMAFQFEKDLIRHTLTHNRDPHIRIYKCPSRSCNYALKGFKRKDHFMRHVRTQHGMDPKPYLAQYER
ncbi:hypothetical protein E6O75_ATG03346 [Venturia nashicola]|uniref:C2H2-type domain-containing protein n=1 Tax=Venturia nashicola TaxID=86259 RepID=A0A4Z1PK12_9PEZI|nr:hypothetical protein E6O75_ATG03346 [Venturia nashicola]